MFTIRKEFKFEMAHRLMSSYSKSCQRIHGHSYILEVFLESETLNEDGMVLDFGHLKDIADDYINSWDHAIVLCQRDNEYINKVGDGIKIVSYNPTAEEMARDIYNHIKDKLSNLENNNAVISKVRLHETRTGWAEYSK